MELNSNQIARILPQAYPFVMIDRVVEFKKGESLTAVKNITANEWPFGSPAQELTVFPETLLLEAAAQAGLVLYHLSKVNAEEKRPQYALGRIKAEFNGSVIPGDQIYIKVLANKMLDTGGYSEIEVSKDNEILVNLELVYSVIKQR